MLDTCAPHHMALGVLDLSAFSLRCIPHKGFLRHQKQKKYSRTYLSQAGDCSTGSRQTGDADDGPLFCGQPTKTERGEATMGQITDDCDS